MKKTKKLYYLIFFIIPVKHNIKCDSQYGAQNHNPKQIDSEFKKVKKIVSKEFMNSITDHKTKNFVMQYCNAIENFYLINNTYQKIERELMSNSVLHGADMVSYVRENLINDSDRRYVAASSHKFRDISEANYFEKNKIRVLNDLRRIFPEPECQKTINTKLKEYIKSYEQRKKADEIQFNLGHNFDNYSSFLRLNLEQKSALTKMIQMEPLLQSLSSYWE